MEPRTDWRRESLICLALGLVTAAVFSPVTRFDFINYDDTDYVTENPGVRRGLTIEGVLQAFTRVHAHNWHPLTTLSHMLDCTLFGLDAGAHHLVNLLFHVAATLLLFLVLRRMTAAVWRSAAVAGLFALHPLHVESVAWVAERKDVLSACFWMLTLWAYLRYTQRGTSSSFALVVVVFALGLMTKPMLVTLPFVLLLLDYWPLGRMRVANGPKAAEQLAVSSPTRLISRLAPLLFEKWPLFALSAVSCVVTFIVQKNSGAVALVEELPVAGRIANALISYVRYVGKLVWPSDLAVLYPLPAAWPAWQVAAAGVVLFALSLVFVKAAGSRPYFAIGWFWFLGTLVPAIGLVQVGTQAMADRYTYVPFIGLLILVVWGLADAMAGWRFQKITGGLLALLALGACGVISAMQLRHWKNSYALFTHTLAVTTNNAVAHNNLATALARMGRRSDAMVHYAEGLRLQPQNPTLQNNLGAALAREGRTDEAIAHYNEAIRAKPDYAEAYNNLGAALFSKGSLPAAVENFRRALSLDPDYPEAHNNLGGALLLQEKPDEAILHFNQALRFNPDVAQTHFNLGIALAKEGRANEAIGHFSEAIRIDPSAAEARRQLGRWLAQRGELETAVAQWREVARLRPDDARAHFDLGLGLIRLQQTATGITELRGALRLRPDWPAALNALAWVLATHENADFRNGAQAVGLAEQAARLTAQPEPTLLHTLAAAYAEARRFDDAINTATQALTLALAAGQTNLAATIQTNLDLFKSGLPFRTTAPP